MVKKILIGTLAASSLLMAADVKEDNAFKTHTELGYIETQGNTKTQTFALDFTAKKGWERHSLKLDIDAQYAKDSDVESKNKIASELAYDYEITKRFAFDYLVGYKVDKFSGFDSQFYTGPGAKYKILNEDAHKWNLNANILYAQDELAKDNTVVPPIAAHTNTYASYVAKTDYTWQMLENLQFVQELSYRAQLDDSNNYFAYSKSALSSKINGNLSMGINYTVDYKNAPPAGKEYSDRTFVVSLNIDY